MAQQERKVLCTIEKGYSSEREEQIGKLRVYFEVFENGDILPINQMEFFCETEQVFVTSGYSDIKERFKNNLFEAICIPTNFDQKDGNCKYVTRANSCDEIKGLQVSQVYDVSLPTPNDPLIAVDDLPLTKTLLIKENGFIYGPFDYTNKFDEKTESYILSLKSINTPLSKIPQYHIGKVGIQKCIANLSNEKRAPLFLSNIKRILETIDEEIDFITDDQILSIYGNKIALNADFRSFTKGTIAQIRKHFSSVTEYRTFPQRFNRLFQCLEDSLAWDSTKTELIQTFLDTKEGKKILVDYISQNKDDYFKEEKANFAKKMEEETKKQKSAFDELKEKKEALESEIRKKTRERNDFEVNNAGNLSSLTDEKRKIIESQIASERNKLDSLTGEVRALEEKYSRLKEYDKLHKEIQTLEDDRDRARDKKKQMEEQVDEVRAKLKENNETLTSRLVKLKPDVDALCGLRPRVAVQQLDYNVPIRLNYSSSDIEDIREDLIDAVLDSLNKQGRKTDYATAANILTTISQCQFTLFSGLPGTGKTSLAKMLGNCLGLGNRFLNIPVARGWTSSRDILGFYNALSQSFSPASTGLYELIQHLSSEIDDNKDPAASIILLDEFNLSQPEHYFSPFLEMADPESKRVLTTGNPDKAYFNIPDYLRFLGTINQDESVQSLTPRLLDRAAIVNFDDFEPNYEVSMVGYENIVNSTSEAISGKKFIDIFKANTLELPADIEKVLQSVVITLRDERPEYGNPIIVSYRKIKAIRSYYNVAGPLMSMESKYLGLDYAISQHVIPLLNGYGQGFGKRLEALILNLPDEMEKSIKMLKKILSHGNQNMFSYGHNL
ncbi:ATPase AAA [Serratia marcescens]|uniref:AAA family ATPase n=2 Tax=Serratia TaxID=613 RepID=UPI000BBFBAB0|nr:MULTISPECIES: AAA family ATPase [Serratia]BCZ60033.1 ATPase AAA [Serratia marcescens]SNY86174.1 ATPase family associated with various cellular activities (AAA) [Serratia sp. JKS000199]